MNLEQARYNMIEQQIRPWDVLDQTVLDVMYRVPREHFAPDDKRSLAYADIEIPLQHQQNMMFPKVEGRMLQDLAIEVTDKCLEIGTGSGYVTACLAHLAAQVHSIDLYEDFIISAKEKLKNQNITNVTLQQGDALTDLEDKQQYDVIAITGSLPAYDVKYEQMLADGGRLFVVVGTAPVMTAMLVTRDGDRFERGALFETQLNPLVGLVAEKSFSF